MFLTITCAPMISHGANEPIPNMPDPEAVADAIYNTAYSAPMGGIEALAKFMKVSKNTLGHKVNPNNTTHYMRADELVAMMFLTGNASVLHVMAQQLGYTCTPAMPCQAQGSATLAFMRLQMAKADFDCAVAEPLACMEAQGDAWVTPAELRRAEAAAGDLHTAVDQLTATLRACKRPVPKAD